MHITKNWRYMLEVRDFIFLFQQQTINSESDEGEIPADFVPSVQFQNVGFAYPSRDNVKVSKWEFMATMINFAFSIAS